MSAREPGYTSRLIKGGALLHDIRLLVRHWAEESTETQKAHGIRTNLLAKASRSRATDIFEYTFVPRFVEGPIPQAWRIVRMLEDRNLALEVLRPVYYWITARSEPLLYEFASEFLHQRAARAEYAVSIADTIAWLRGKLAPQGKNWSAVVTIRVAQGLLSALRDFGVVEGRAKKRIAPVHLPIEAFTYVAFALHEQGASGERLIQHGDWRIFLLTPQAVEHLFLEAHQCHLIDYHAAGKLVRIEFRADSLEAMADALVARPH